jgi:hypothetical protein
MLTINYYYLNINQIYYYNLIIKNIFKIKNKA